MVLAHLPVCSLYVCRLQRDLLCSDRAPWCKRPEETLPITPNTLKNDIMHSRLYEVGGLSQKHCEHQARCGVLPSRMPRQVPSRVMAQSSTSVAMLLWRALMQHQLAVPLLLM